MTQCLQSVVVLFFVGLAAGCSSLSREAQSIPEIQGIWRYSENRHHPSTESLWTYEFQADQFRVSAAPSSYAHGFYTFKPESGGAYTLNLKVKERRNFEDNQIKVQPLGGQMLIINQNLYRRILRQ